MVIEASKKTSQVAKFCNVKISRFTLHTNFQTDFTLSKIYSNILMLF